MIEGFVKNFIKNKSTTVVFFGDSVTKGCFESFEGRHGTTDYEAVYHNQLKKIVNYLYPENIFNTINSGVGGECAGEAIKRMERDVIGYHPDLVVVCFGLNDINDSCDHYISALTDIFSYLNKAGIPCVFMTPNSFNTSVTKSILVDYAGKTADYQNGGKMDRYMSEAVKAAEENGVYVCDCYKVWKHMNTIGVDINKLLANGINHPQREMHKLFAYRLFDTIFMNND